MAVTETRAYLVIGPIILFANEIRKKSLSAYIYRGPRIFTVNGSISTKYTIISIARYAARGPIQFQAKVTSKEHIIPQEESVMR